MFYLKCIDVLHLSYIFTIVTCITNLLIILDMYYSLEICLWGSSSALSTSAALETALHSEKSPLLVDTGSLLSALREIL